MEEDSKKAIKIKKEKRCIMYCKLLLMGFTIFGFHHIYSTENATLADMVAGCAFLTFLYLLFFAYLTIKENDLNEEVEDRPEEDI